MKKLILVLFCLNLFCGLCACNQKSPDVTAVTTGLLFTAEISLNDYKECFFVKSEADGALYLECCSDKNKTSNDYLFKNSTVTYIYKDLEYETEISSLPDSFIIDLIPVALNEIRGKELSYKNKKYFVKGNTEKYSFTVYCGASGLPIEIVEQNKGIKIKLGDIKVIS